MPTSKLQSSVPAPRRSPLAAGLRSLAAVGLALLAWSCGTEEIAYDTLYLRIHSQPPNAAGTITRLDLALLDLESGDTVKLPKTPNDPNFNFVLPPGHNVVTKPYLVKVVPSGATAGRLRLRVRGLDDAGTVLTAYAGVIDTRQKAEFDVLLKTMESQALCDADGDGTPDCKKAGCCADPAACLLYTSPSPRDS